MRSNSTDPPPGDAGPRLHRVLGLWDLVLFNAAAIVSIRWLSTAAQAGPSSLLLWGLALLIFFLPLGLTVLELHGRFPEEGGLYRWAQAAFGDGHGFVAGWAYWVSNLAYFPSLLLFGSEIFFFLGGDDWRPAGREALFSILFTVALLWLVIGVNILGIERARWVQNIGGLGVVVVLLVLAVAGGAAWGRFGSATDFGAGLVPDLARLPTLSFFATMTFAFVGLELAPVMGGEIRHPHRTVPRAMLIGGVLIAGVYLLGTAALLVALPAADIHVITGIPQAVAAIGERLALPQVGVLLAAFIVLATTGQLAAWVSGAARLPYVVGLDRYLPRPFGRLHPRWGSPYVALLTQGAIATALLLAAHAGATVEEAYWVLLDMTLLLTFLPFLYLFAALPVLRAREAGGAGFRIPGGRTATVLVAATGFAATLLSMGFALIPPAGSDRPGLFFLKVLGGCALMIGVGMGFYGRGRRGKG